MMRMDVCPRGFEDFFMQVAVKTCLGILEPILEAEGDCGKAGQKRQQG
jgi:hypothetical protein